MTASCGSYSRAAGLWLAGPQTAQAFARAVSITAIKYGGARYTSGFGNRTILFSGMRRGKFAPRLGFSLQPAGHKDQAEPSQALPVLLALCGIITAVNQSSAQHRSSARHGQLRFGQLGEDAFAPLSSRHASALILTRSGTRINRQDHAQHT
jgi:hypothetical protein